MVWQAGGRGRKSSQKRISGAGSPGPTSVRAAQARGSHRTCSSRHTRKPLSGRAVTFFPTISGAGPTLFFSFWSGL